MMKRQIYGTISKSMLKKSGNKLIKVKTKMILAVCLRFLKKSKVKEKNSEIP